MSQLFRGRSEADTAQRLERELQSLEQQARTASPGYETQFLNRAGNLCVEAGEPKRALGFYGRAIDAYLESGRFSAAEVVCKKVLEIAPNAVRTRCTLAWLAIGKGYRAGADQDIAEYVNAAKRAGQEALAARQLHMMAEAAVSPELRERLAEHLLDLGEAADADRVFATVYQERNGLRASPITDEGKLWAKLLKAALMGPQELKERRAAEEADGGDDLLPQLREEA
jgi:tetratricopeptide (TPR) repeat protein